MDDCILCHFDIMHSLKCNCHECGEGIEYVSMVSYGYRMPVVGINCKHTASAYWRN